MDFDRNEILFSTFIFFLWNDDFHTGVFLKTGLMFTVLSQIRNACMKEICIDLKTAKYFCYNMIVIKSFILCKII